MNYNIDHFSVEIYARVKPTGRIHDGRDVYQLVGDFFGADEKTMRATKDSCCILTQGSIYGLNKLYIDESGNSFVLLTIDLRR